VIEPTNWWKTKVVMFIAEHTPKCHDITRLISQSMDRPLPLKTRLSMRVHYAICVWCERYRDHLLVLRKAVRGGLEGMGDGDQRNLPADARAQLKTVLKPKE
jgi:hypothetical protein